MLCNFVLLLITDKKRLHAFVSQKYCDTRLFLKDVEVHCSHKKCVNFKSDVLNEYYDGNEYDDDSYSFKDYRYRR